MQTWGPCAVAGAAMKNRLALILIAYVQLGEGSTALQVVGSAFILAGIIMVARAAARGAQKLPVTARRAPA